MMEKLPVFVGRVLVCEDNLTNQFIIENDLKAVGLQVDVAKNGQVAVAMVMEKYTKRQLSYDLILMDILMPIMDGIKAATLIHEGGIKTPIVAMSGDVLAESKADLLAIGIRETLPKPYEKEALWALLERYLIALDSRSQQVLPETQAAEGENDAAIKAKVAERFLFHNRTKYQEIEQAIHHGDLVTAHRLAHSLKGVAGMLDLYDLQAKAMVVEAVLAKQEIPTLQDLQELKVVLAAAVDEMAAALP